MTQHVSFKRIIIVACAATAIALAGCNRGDPRDNVARAKALIEKNDHRAATLELKNALQKDPKFPEARYLLGQELMVQGDSRNAEIELKKALELKYDPDRTVPRLARSQIQQGNAETVIRETGTIPLKSPAANAELQTLVGVAMFSLGRFDEADKAFAAATSLVPDFPEAVLGAARAKATRGDLKGATVMVDAILAKNPNQVDGLILKGDIARAQAMGAEAIANYEKALALDPYRFTTRLNLASVYFSVRDMVQGQKQVDILKKQAPRDPTVAYLDAAAALSRKDLARANESVAVTLSSNPSNPKAQFLAGAIAAALGQPVQAEQYLRDTLKSAPDSLGTRKMLANLYLQQKRGDKADEVLQPALAAAPNDPEVLSLAGEAALQKGDFAGALKSFDKVAKLNPADATVRSRSAAILFGMGNVDGAVAELESASQANKTNNPVADITLVLAHLQLKEYDKALTAWKVLEKRQPASPVTYNLLAAIDTGKKDTAGARTALEKAVALSPTYYPAVDNLARMDVQDKNVDGARKRYKDLLAKDPKSEPTLMALAQLEESQGASSETVLSLLREARQANPDSPRVINTLSSFYVSRGDPKSALAVVQAALASSPDNPQYLERIGQLLLQTGSVDQAIATFQKLGSLQPSNVEYQLRLGQAQLIAGQTKIALQTFGSAVKQKPDSPELQKAVVGMMLEAHKVDEASRLITDIRSQSPKSPALPELDADLKFAAKQYDEAALGYRKALAATPRSGLVIKTYSALALSDKRSDADALLADWLKNHPKDTTVRLFDGDVAMRYADYPRAIRSYRAVFDERPNDPSVLNNLAWALWEQKDPKALAMAEKASALAPANAEVSDTLGWMLVEQGQTKRGVELLEKANAAAPQQRDIALHLAKAQIKAGSNDAARSILQKLVKAAPNSPEGKESLELLARL